MERYEELVDALRQASRSVAGLADPSDRVRLQGQSAAIARLEACLSGGVEGLDGGRRLEAAALADAALRANGLNLKWTRLRARLACIGVSRVAPVGQNARLLDLVS